ncbi:T-cell receptor-associated transmembrane adapter 1 isoform X3 [Callorhinchus milii]|uniref:T-cell receptor-associated transmembrane adapter 1 isoform X3 n=1 Tax=Callorhinchus milii TaxID=7868 RepID=UPI00045712FC|nr:T-cell receptor-associated transmembrane adapter 1 isoform X3 [Callorhinchus milii]|eukprot:gi/632956519/ref/XP_007893996.1/ PREDICTED: T-cell receptor-associated transmembrane adapter 1 isoform X2 [Callorhinchus milii]
MGSADNLANCSTPFWIMLGITLLALIISLIVNVIYCTAAPRKVPGPKYTAEVKHTHSLVSLEIEEIDDAPIYGNVVQDSVEDQNESCYESMTPANKAAVDIKVAESSQMCYASLDLSTEQKKRHRKMENKQVNYDELDLLEDDNLPLKSNTLRSRTSIYLNSDQLVFNGATKQEEEESIHADPIKLYSMINATRSGMPISDNNIETGFENSNNDVSEY